VLCLDLVMSVAVAIMLGAMKSLSLCFPFALGLLISSAQGQTTPGKLTFALPVHPGQMTVEQGKWQIVELSAKSNGNEWGE
jgi:hypothetical protein